MLDYKIELLKQLANYKQAYNSAAKMAKSTGNILQFNDPLYSSMRFYKQRILELRLKLNNLKESK